jgi:hypothetical protein
MKQIGKTRAKRYLVMLQRAGYDNGKWSIARFMNGRGDYGCTQVIKNNGKPILAVSLDGCRVHTQFFVDEPALMEAICSK